MYRVCRKFRLMKRNDYFWLAFDNFWSKCYFLKQLDRIKNRLWPKILPLCTSLTNLSLFKSSVLFLFMRTVDILICINYSNIKNTEAGGNPIGHLVYIVFWSHFFQLQFLSLVNFILSILHRRRTDFSPKSEKQNISITPMMKVKS